MTRPARSANAGAHLWVPFLSATDGRLDGTDPAVHSCRALPGPFNTADFRKVFREKPSGAAYTTPTHPGRVPQWKSAPAVLSDHSHGFQDGSSTCNRHEGSLSDCHQTQISLTSQVSRALRATQSQSKRHAWVRVGAVLVLRSREVVRAAASCPLSDYHLKRGAYQCYTCHICICDFDFHIRADPWVDLRYRPAASSSICRR